VNRPCTDESRSPASRTQLAESELGGERTVGPAHHLLQGDPLAACSDRTVQRRSSGGRLSLMLATALAVTAIGAPALAIPSIGGYKNCNQSTVWVGSHASGSIWHKHGGPYGTDYIDGYWFHSWNGLQRSSTTEQATTWRVQATGTLFDSPWTFAYCVSGGPT